jgi:hypothetical protein
MTDRTNEVTELGLLAELLADPSTWVEPRPGLEDAIVRAVSDAPSSGASSSTPVPTAVHHHSARRRRIVMAALGAAAAVLAFVGGLALVSRGGTGSDYEAQLTATVVAPRAHAAATIDKSGAGFRIALDAHGLPPLPDGGYYAAWLKNGAGTVVPIGTFSSSDGMVTLWSGVSPATFPTISVTVQSAGDGATPGRRVLIGRVHAH